MFYTVGEKIRQVRQQFHLKQGIFQHFGITQHYLSMIETNKRQPPEKTLIDIYDALVTLTEGEMRSLYTLDEFLKNPEEQAREFFEQRLTIDTIVDQYDELMSVAKQYNLTSYMIQLDKLLGQYYFMRNDGQEAVKHFQIAIDRAIKEDINPYHLYQQFGIMLRKLGRYVESISKLSIAIGYAKTEEQIKEIDALLILTYYQMGQHQLALEMINQLTSKANIYPSKHYVKAILIKVEILRNNGLILESRDYLLALLDEPEYEPYLKHIYHSLGWNYIANHEYSKALEILKKAFSYRESDLEKALTLLLIGAVYFEMEEYEEAQSYYTQIKSTILSSWSTNSKKMWFDKQLDLYWRTKQMDKVVLLQQELKELVETEALPEDTVNQIKKTFLKQVSTRTSLSEEEYSPLYNFLVF